MVWKLELNPNHPNQVKRRTKSWTSRRKYKRQPRQGLSHPCLSLLKTLNPPTSGKASPNSINSNPILFNSPFPHRFRHLKEESEKDILNTFRKVRVNIPLIDAIKQVPKFAKFLKEICTTKRRFAKKR